MTKPKPGAGGRYQMIDMAGKRVGRLQVLRHDGSNGNAAMWRCKCHCGNEISVAGVTLRSGRVKSCGCLRKLYYNKRRHRGGRDGMRYDDLADFLGT